MGGGVSSLPAEFSLAEAKELAGARWQPAWEENFADAKISRDEAVRCWKESEAKAAISEELYEKLHGTNRSGVAEALDFSAILNEKRGQHLAGTREWVFDAVENWRVAPDAAKLFWLIGGGGTGKSVAAAELLARLLDKQNVAAWHFCKHTEPARSAPAVLLRSLAGMLCVTVEGFEDALKKSAGVETDKVDELFEALVAKPLRIVEAPRGPDDALVLILDALDELPREALKPVLSLLANELKTLPSWIKLVVTSRDEAQIKAALRGYTPTELRVDEGRNQRDVRVYLTGLALKHVEFEVTMESLRREVEAKFPELTGRLGGFAALEDPLRRAKATYAEAMRGVSGLDKLEAYRERRDPNLKQDEGDFETLYAQAAVAQKVLVKSLRKLHDDDSSDRSPAARSEHARQQARQKLRGVKAMIGASRAFSDAGRRRREHSVVDPGIKGRPRSLEKLANDYGGDARYLKDLSRATILCETPDELLDVLNRLKSVGLEIAQVKNKFASPTPMGYRDFNLNIRVRLDDGSTHIAEFQVNLNCVLAAKKIAHKQYEVIRAALPAMCMGTSVEAEALEAFISERLNSSALDAAVTSLERKAGGLMLYARLIADQLEATSGKIDFASVGALPAGLDEIYAENFRRVFVDNGAWSDALPLVQLICAAAEPLTVDAASGALGWDRARCERLCADVSLLFPLREGDVIGVLHKTVTDWLTGEAPFDKRSAEDVFFVARGAAHRRLAWACARAIRAGVLDTEAYSSDAAADVALASFVEGECGVASDAYALRWCLFHIKQSCFVSEAVAVACSLSYVQKRSAGDIVSFVADLRALKGQDTLLLSDALVLSRNFLSRGLPLLEQLWQRLTPRANAESSPAARRLADDAKRAASRLPLSFVRPMGLAAAGGAERCRIEVGAKCMAMFVDPATGEPRVACGCDDKKVRIYDPVAGGAALVVIDLGSDVKALTVFKDPVTGEPRLACGCYDGKVRIFDPIAGGEALLVLDAGDFVFALVVFEDLVTGAPRLVTSSGKVFDPVAGGEALLVLHIIAIALAVFAEGAPRLACASGEKVLVFDPVAGGEALLVLDIGSRVPALSFFKEPATSAPRLACGSRDGKVRVFDAVSGGDALLVFDTGYSTVNALVVFKDLATGVLRLATSYGKIFDPLAGGEALVVLKGCGGSLVAFTDPATGAPRLVSGSEKGTVRVWNPAVSGAAIDAEPEGHSDRVKALVTFVDPATGALRVATGSDDKTICVWDAETGDTLLVIDVGSEVLALAFFVDPETSAPRLASGSEDGKVRVFDAVAGGEALLVIDVGSEVLALAFFTDPATGAPRLACGCEDGKVHVFDPVPGGEALVVITAGSDVYALAVFADPATGEPRLACGAWREVRIYDPVAGGEALAVLPCWRTKDVLALTVFTDPATGGIRLASGSTTRSRQLFGDIDRVCPGRTGNADRSVRVWDLAAGGALLFVLEGHTDDVEALTAFTDPATGETRLASGSRDKTLRVWDASTGASLRVVPFEDEVKVLTVGRDTSGLFVAFGKRWGELRIESGTTPLTLACYQGDVDAISALLQQGAGVDQEDYDGYTPLFVASSKGDANAARLLLDAGAAVDKRREGDWSPFGIACALGHVDVATLLLDRGAAVDLCLDGATPLLFAYRKQNLDAMWLCLERGADSNWENEEGGTILYDACNKGLIDAVRLLLDKGADVNRAKENGATPLFVACEGGHVDAVRLLLDKGAEVDRADKRGRTPLKVAKHSNHDSVVALLEEHLDSKFPLHAAARTGDVDLMTQLLDGGAEVDAKKDGETPLYMACEKGHVDAARLLLDTGAEVDRATNWGTQLSIAKRKGHSSIVALLEKQLDSKFPLHAAARSGDVDEMTQLLDCGAEVDAKKDGATPLFVACENGNVDATRLLLDKGAEVEQAVEGGATPLLVACQKGSATPLLVACQNGHVDAARLLLGKGADVDRASRYGETPLYTACEKGHVDAARLLLDKGAEVDRAVEGGATPLLVACQNGHVDAARLLLENGAEVEPAPAPAPVPGRSRSRDRQRRRRRLDSSRDRRLGRATKDGATPLYIACEKGHVDLARLLLEKGAEVDRATEGATPLYAACMNGHVDAARLLLEKDAAVDRANKDGRTPLYAACQEGHVDAARLLLEKGAEVDRMAENGATPLYAACKYGHVDAARLLLEKGAEVDRMAENGATPLYAACKYGHVDAARLLLEKGADVHKASDDNRTPLHTASYEGHIDVVRLLLANGADADLDIKDKHGDTPVADAKRKGHSAVVALHEEQLDLKFPLHAAARTGDVEAMTQLLDGGAEVDAEKDGATPLYIACQEGHVDAARLVLDKGAEVDQAKKNGWTPLLIACFKGHVDAAQLLLGRGAEVDRANEKGATPLFIACWKGHVDAARLLLDKGAEVDRAEKNSWTPLFIACQNGSVDAARLLLDKGAEVDRATEEGMTPLDIAKRRRQRAVVALLEEHMDLKFPLHAAARTGDVEAMTQLLDGGAEVDAKKDGATPLIIACQEGHVDAARLLLNKDAEVNRADEDGRTPLYAACWKGHVDAAQLLLDNGADANRAKENGATPLGIAQERGHSSIVTMLEEHQK